VNGPGEGLCGQLEARHHGEVGVEGAGELRGADAVLRDYDDAAAAQQSFIRGATRPGIGSIRCGGSWYWRGWAPCSYVREVIDAQMDSIDRRIAKLETLGTRLAQLSAEARLLPQAGAGVSCRLIERAAGRFGYRGAGMCLGLERRIDR
jgi:hypothetical protein